MKKLKKLVAVLVVTGMGTVASMAQTDPTAIYSTAQTDFNAAVGIAITAIGIGAAIFYIRKGLKGRM